MLLVEIITTLKALCLRALLTNSVTLNLTKDSNIGVSNFTSNIIKSIKKPHISP